MWEPNTFVQEELKAPEQKKFKGSSFTSIQMKYDGEDCLVRVKGNYKLFEHNRKGKKFYSLGLRIDDDNREWWKSLEAKIQKLAGQALGKLSKPENFILIKTSEKRCSNVCNKVYANSCKCLSLTEDGRDSIPFKEMIGEG